LQAQTKIAKVQEGFEGSLYSLDQAKKRIASGDPRQGRKGKSTPPRKHESIDFQCPRHQSLEGGTQVSP
jgi:hypothetical protein